MKKNFMILGITTAFLLYVASSATAYSVGWTYGEENVFVDLSAERLIETGNPNGLLDEGEYLRGIFDIDQIISPNSFDFSPPNPQLTGIFELEVKSKEQVYIDPSLLNSPGNQFGYTTSDGGGTFLKATVTDKWEENLEGTNLHGLSDGDTLTTDLYKYTFGASATFESTYGAGALLAVYIDDDHDYQSTDISIGDAETTVTNGDLYWTFGLGDTGEWNILGGPENINIFKYAVQTDVISSTTIGLNLLSNPLGPDLVQDIGFRNSAGDVVKVDMRASLSLNGIGEVNTDFDLNNKLNGNLKPIPEPATFALFGFGLLSIAAVSRGRQKD